MARRVPDRHTEARKLRTGADEKMTRRIALTLVVGFLLAGCGGSDDKDGLALMGCPPDSGVGTSTLTPAQKCVAQKLGIVEAEHTRYTIVPEQSLNGCDVALILTSKEAVALYAGAGDTVATDPPGTVGIKTTPDCEAQLSDALAAAEQ